MKNQVQCWLRFNSQQWQGIFFSQSCHCSFLYSVLTVPMYYHIQPGPSTVAPAVLVKQLQQHSQRRIHQVDEAQLCGSKPSHWAHSTPSFGQRPARAEKSYMILMGYKPKTFWPTVRGANHSLWGRVHLILDNILDDMGTEWLYDPNACCGWPADGWQHDPYSLMRLNVKIHCKL